MSSYESSLCPLKPRCKEPYIQKHANPDLRIPTPATTAAWRQSQLRTDMLTAST